jgi:hypothetical protein
MKYKLEVYGWSMESVAHSLNDEQLEKVDILMRDNNSDELWEVRHLMEDDIIDDMWDPDMFQMSAPFYNGRLFFKVIDENDNVVAEFEEKDLGDEYENVGDVDEIYPYQSFLASPHYRDDGVEHVLLIIDEQKGGIYEMMFESEQIPVAQDFSVMGGSIDTPDGEWDFVSRIFFKDQLLEIHEWMDNMGKAATVEIYTQDGRIIN